MPTVSGHGGTVTLGYDADELNKTTLIVDSWSIHTRRTMRDITPFNRARVEQAPSHFLTRVDLTGYAEATVQTGVVPNRIQVFLDLTRPTNVSQPLNMHITGFGFIDSIDQRVDVAGAVTVQLSIAMNSAPEETQ